MYDEAINNEHNIGVNLVVFVYESLLVQCFVTYEKRYKRALLDIIGFLISVYI
jgi:hypothetical protein